MVKKLCALLLTVVMLLNGSITTTLTARENNENQNIAKPSFTAEKMVDDVSNYTVEFTYNGSQYVLDGNSSVALEEILNALGLSGVATNVEVSNPELIKVEDDTVYAVKAFLTTEWMKVTIDGITYEIVVTDTIPGETVTGIVDMGNGETKEGDFTITGGPVRGPQSGTATIKGSTVTNNANNTAKGGVNETTGSAFISRTGGNLLLDSTTINTSTKSLVINIWANATAELKDSTLNGEGVEWGNVPFMLVGAYNGVSGTLNVSGTSAINNTNGAVAGGNGNSVINVNSGTFTISNSTIALKNDISFKVKSGATLVLDNTTLNVDGMNNKPAIIVEEGGKLILQNSSVEATQSKAFNNGIIVSDGGDIEIIDSEISNITKTSGNSSIIEVKNGGNLTITNSKLENNVDTAAKGGVVLVNNGGTITIEGTTSFKNNKSGNSQIYVGNTEKLEISDSAIFDGNNGGNYGGAIWANNTPVIINDGVTFTNNTAYFGGAVYFENCNGTEIGKATFKNNGAQFEEDESWEGSLTQDGGALYIRGGETKITGTIFEENLAATPSNSSGGAAYINGGNAVIKGAKFLNNTALIYGGALTVAHDADVYIEDLNGDPTEFKGNVVPYGTGQTGGALFINNGYVRMTDAAIYNNSAQDAGGGISTCTTGTVQIRVLEGAAIFDNNILSTDNPDIEGIDSYKDVFLQTIDHTDADTGEAIPGRNGFPNYVYELFERMFNGGIHNWKAKPLNTINDQGQRLNSLIAQSNPNNKDVSRARVVFTENVALAHPDYDMVSGGAIGCNGLLEIGTSTEIKILKLWDDANDKDGKRPTVEDFLSKVKIYADGVEVNKDELLIDVITEDVENYVIHSNVINESGEQVEFDGHVPWLIIVSGLKKYSDDAGQNEIVYTINEVQVEEYEEPVISGTAKTYFKITNTHIPETTSIEVVKIWEDPYSIYKTYPTVTVALVSEGEEVATAELNESNGWKYEFKELDPQKKYTVIEKSKIPHAVTEISETESGFEIKNVVRPWIPETPNDEHTSLTITKTQEGLKEGESYKVKITINDFSETIELKANDKYTYDLIPIGSKVTVKEDESEAYTATYYVDGEALDGNEFVVLSKKEVVCRIHNKSVPKDVPDTSDNSNNSYWMTIFSIALMLVLATTSLKKKYQ